MYLLNSEIKKKKCLKSFGQKFSNININFNSIELASEKKINIFKQLKWTKYLLQPKYFWDKIMKFPDVCMTFLVFKISNLQNSLTLKKNQVFMTSSGHPDYGC